MYLFIVAKSQKVFLSRGTKLLFSKHSQVVLCKQKGDKHKLSSIFEDGRNGRFFLGFSHLYVQTKYLVDGKNKFFFILYIFSMNKQILS